MHLKDFFPFPLVISLFISIFSHGFPKYVCGIDFRYAACNSSVECGRLGKIHYPFWVYGSQSQYCGRPRFNLYCLKDEATILIGVENFHVMDLDDRTQTLKIARIHEPSTGNITCPYFNASMNSTSFSYTSDVEIIRVLHNCRKIKFLSSYKYPCGIVNNKQSHSYFVANTSLANRYRSKCGYSALLPVLASAAEGLMNGSLDVGEALSKGFEVKWTEKEAQCKECMESGGRCGYDLNMNRPSCFCRDQPYPESCPGPLAPAIPPTALDSPQSRILLDGGTSANFFGLAESYPRKGCWINFNCLRDHRYVALKAPFRKFGRASHKSDIYTYGMMVLAIIEEKKA